MLRLASSVTFEDYLEEAFQTIISDGGEVKLAFV